VRVLALETSERVGSLTTMQVSEGSFSEVRGTLLPSDQRSARSLLPTIQTLLAESGWKPTQLDLLCVTTGPGSFTGIRIGVTTAKTLAYATGAALVEVHTLAAIAAAVSTPQERLWTILDAQRQELFVAQFKPDWQDHPDDIPETHIVGVEQWLQELVPGDVVSGPPLQKLADRLPAGVHVVDAEDWKPRAEAVGRLGVAAYQRGRSVDAIQLVPRYYRKSAAEEKADA